MKQASLGAGFERKVKNTPKRAFLRQMEQGVTWQE